MATLFVICTSVQQNMQRNLHSNDAAQWDNFEAENFQGYPSDRYHELNFKDLTMALYCRDFKAVVNPQKTAKIVVLENFPTMQ